METKEQYYSEVVLRNRELAKKPEVLRCQCPNKLCDWHGNCKVCVALHRYHADHIPYCLQPIIKNKIIDLSRTVEMFAQDKEGTPIEYRQYVKEQDRLKIINKK